MFGERANLALLTHVYEVEVVEESQEEDTSRSGVGWAVKIDRWYRKGSMTARLMAAALGGFALRSHDRVDSL